MILNPILGKRYKARCRFHDSLHSGTIRAREQIVEGVLASAAPRERPCLCGGADEKLLSLVDRWGLPVFSMLCMDCGLIRLSPVHEDDVYETIYKNYYWPLCLASQDLTRSRFERSVRRARPSTCGLAKWIDLKGKRLLELGCSYGAGLHCLRETGASLVGYDYDERFLDMGRQLTGLDLRSGGLDSAIADGERYDVVVLRHVFEHFSDPVVQGSRLRSLLDSGGVLFVEVPGVLSEDRWRPDPLLGFDYFHPFHYSLMTLRMVMSLAGLSLIKGDERVYSLWREDQNMNILKPDCHEGARILGFIRRMEQKRRWNAMSFPLLSRIPWRRENRETEENSL